MIAAGTFETMIQPLLKKLNELLLEHFAIGRKDDMGIPLLSGDALDVALWNIIVDEQTGEWVIIDREWTCNDVIPADFILWRNLYHFITRFRAYLGQRYARKSTDELTYEILQRLYPSCNRERCRSALQFDQSFQDFVNYGITKGKSFLTSETSYQNSESPGHDSRSD
jgi:hypothetical protein